VPEIAKTKLDKAMTSSSFVEEPTPRAHQQCRRRSPPTGWSSGDLIPKRTPPPPLDAVTGNRAQGPPPSRTTPTTPRSCRREEPNLRHRIWELNKNTKSGKKEPHKLIVGPCSRRQKTKRTHSDIAEVEAAPPSPVGGAPRPAAAEAEATRTVAGTDAEETKGLIQR